MSRTNVYAVLNSILIFGILGVAVIATLRMYVEWRIWGKAIREASLNARQELATA